METKWTPGPWQSHLNKSDTSWLVKTTNQIGKPTCIASVDWWTNPDPVFPSRIAAEANARLIAAAPDLFEALNNAIWWGHSNILGEKPQWFVDAVAALSKATSNPEAV